MFALNSDGYIGLFGEWSDSKTKRRNSSGDKFAGKRCTLSCEYCRCWTLGGMAT
jgi:hypothetical protein